jgi:hypothetical protein
MFSRIFATLIVVGLTTGCGAPSPAARPEAKYDDTTGRLRTLSLDANRNGRVETVSYMDGARIMWVEVDQDENGKVDRWDFYGTARQLEKVGFSRQNDGVMDAIGFYDSRNVLIRMEISTARDGRFDRVETYVDGRLAAAGEDTNGDGRPDKWDEYRESAAAGQTPEYDVVATLFDHSGSGRPDRRFVYGPNGTIERVEIDPDGDGVFIPERVGSK